MIDNGWLRPKTRKYETSREDERITGSLGTKQEGGGDAIKEGKIRTPMVRVLGQGRVATLALLHEMSTQNVARAPGPFHHMRRGSRKG